MTRQGKKDIESALEAFREILAGHNLADFMQRMAGHLDDIHASDGPEEQKLLAKDKALIDLRVFLRDYILACQARMSPEVAWAFVFVWLCLRDIAGILIELKRHAFPNMPEPVGFFGATHEGAPKNAG